MGKELQAIKFFLYILFIYCSAILSNRGIDSSNTRKIIVGFLVPFFQFMLNRYQTGFDRTGNSNIYSATFKV